MKNILVGLFILLLISFKTNKKNDSTPQKNIMITQEAIEKTPIIEISGEKGADIEVRLNDIPVSKLSLDKEGSGNSFSQVKYYLKSGINTISVYSFSKKGKATIRLINYKKGDLTGSDDGEKLVEIIVDNDDTPIHKNIELSSDIRWSWVDTDNITDKKSKEEAITFAKKIYQFMIENNVEEMVAAADPILDYDIVSKPNASKEQLVEQWTKGLKMIFDGSNIFDDINSIEIELVPIANGQLFEVKRKDGSLFFRTSDKNESMVGFKNIIGRKNGLWNFYH